MFLLSKEVLFLELIITAITCLHILYYKERNILAWMGLVILTPFWGTAFYLMFGINRVERLANKLRSDHKVKQKYSKFYNKEAKLHPDIIQHYNYSQLIHQQGFVDGNQITALINGDRVYPEMLKAIKEAEQSVALSTYIFEKGKAGDQFIEELTGAVKRGVEVRVIIDPFNRFYQLFNKIDRTFRKKGIQYALFLKPRSPLILKFLNLRNHRKLLMVDGKIGFIGGINIRDRHVLKDTPNKKQAARDTHFKVRGPIINQMNIVFEEDWYFSKKEKIVLPRWQGPFPQNGDGYICRIVPDGPDRDIWKMQNMLLGMLNFAREEIRIVTPYFLPNAILLSTLIFIARKGVKVELVLPEKSNLFYFSWASEANYRELLDAGIKIYLSGSPFDHSKLMLVDDYLAVIGSGNWDERSIRLNFEVNMEIVNRKFNKELRKIYNNKKRGARVLKLSEVRNYSFARIIRNNFFKMFENIL